MASAFTQFSRAFYVINGIELLERGAYYSTSAVLTLYMTRGLGLQPAAAGGILALLLFLLYAVPLLAAALSRKFGYKASLVVAFALLAAGYASFFLSSSVALVLVAVLLVGFGAGTFKPIAAALVGETTTEEQRNFAYILYYGAINVGAFVFPLSVGIIGSLHPNDIVFLARTAFVAAVSLVTINLVLSLLVFRNIRDPEKHVNALASLKSLVGIFRDPKFLVLLVIYAGFWFMYATSLSFITQYMADYVQVPLWFNAAIQQSINPLIIILAAPVVGSFTKRIESLALMSVGIALYVLGFVVVGATTLFAPFLVGIAIFSFGELLTQPSFLSYVSKIAPQDRVAVYMSYGFLPIAVGLPLGSSIGGALYQVFGTNAHQPRLFWAVLAAVGLVTIAALLLYNRFLEGAKKRDVAPGPERGRRRGFPVGVALAVVALLLVPALVGAAALTSPAGTAPGAPALSSASVGAGSTVQLADDAQQLACGKDYTTTVTLPANATGNATFTVTWTTPPPSNPAASSTPDTYELHVTPPGGSMAMAPASTKSPLTVTAPAAPGAYSVDVKLDQCGSEAVMVPVLGPAPAGASQRTQGSFTLGGSYQTAG
jgi:dipeptide/tripeptide permease